jgi:ABC-type branched-subunit amino acid transport system permease subunit
MYGDVMTDQRDAQTTRSTLVVLRAVTAVLAVCALLIGLVMSDRSTSDVLLGAGLVFGAVAVCLAIATGALRRLSLGSAIVLALGVILVGLVLIDLTNG